MAAEICNDGRRGLLPPDTLPSSAYGRRISPLYRQHGRSLHESRRAHTCARHCSIVNRSLEALRRGAPAPICCCASTFAGAPRALRRPGRPSAAGHGQRETGACSFHACLCMCTDGTQLVRTGRVYTTHEKHPSVFRCSQATIRGGAGGDGEGSIAGGQVPMPMVRLRGTPLRKSRCYGSSYLLLRGRRSEWYEMQPLSLAGAHPESVVTEAAIRQCRQPYPGSRCIGGNGDLHVAVRAASPRHLSHATASHKCRVASNIQRPWSHVPQ